MRALATAVVLGLLSASGPAAAQHRPSQHPGSIQPFSSQVETALRRAAELVDTGLAPDAVALLDRLSPRARANPRVVEFRALSRVNTLVPSIDPGAWQTLAPNIQRELTRTVTVLARSTEPRAAVALGRLALLQNHLDTARAHFETALRAHPADPVTWNDLAMVLVALRHLPEAENALRTATTLAPTDPEPFDNLGAVILAQGRAQDSLVAFERAVSLSPRTQRYLSDLGSALLSTGNFSLAVTTYQRALALDPQSSVVTANLGYALSLANRSAEAIDTLSHAITLNPRNVTALNNLGLVHLHRGELTDARLCFERALSIDPNDPRAHANLSALQSPQISPVTPAVDRATSARDAGLR